jgi:iron(III) transport system substrate-binding protein
MESMFRFVVLTTVAFVLVGCAPAPPSPTAAPPKQEAKPTAAAPAQEAKPAASPAAAPAPAAKPAASPAAAPAEKAAPAPAASPAAAPAASPAAAAKPATSGRSPALQEMIEGARREGKIQVWIVTPGVESTRREIFEAFNKHWGLNLEWEWVAVQGPQGAARIEAETKGGAQTADAVYGSADNALQLSDQDMLQSVDWLGVFGNELPNLQAALDSTVAEMRGKLLPQKDPVYILAYNKEQVQEQELPTTFEDLADPKWRGKLAINRTGTPWDTLALAWGRERSTEQFKKVLANGPLLKEGAIPVTQAVVSGEAALGIGILDSVELQKARGVPVDWRALDYLPALPLYLYIPKNAAHPNAAKLFAAWYATEGIKIAAQREYHSLISDPNSFVAVRLKTEVPNVQIVYPRTVGDMRLRFAVGEELGPLVTAPR